ncbi:MAG: two-component system response regulator [Nitrospirales bacterium]|nr:MAG: two-component system response regulator [Nitrospirales bacterium]
MNRPNARERILIVDDEESILDAMAEAIRLLDLTVITAKNGDDAWEKFEKERPDVVVTDVRMPQRDGFMLTTQIKASRPSCPVIVVTGYGSEQAAVAALKAGASDYLVKPFQVSELRSAVDRACSLLRAQWADEYVMAIVDDITSHLVINNIPEMLGSVVNLVIRSMTGCLSDQQLLSIRIALHELLMNAIEHGNLHITPEEKIHALMNDQYEQLLQVRRDDPQYNQRRVRLFYTHNVHMGKVNMRIVDDGDGFEWETVLGRDIHTLPQTARSGRGIFLVQTLVPDVMYHGKGNEVTFSMSHASVRQ